MYMYIYSDEWGYNRQTSERQTSDTNTHTRTETRDGDSAGSTRVFCGAKAAFGKPAQCKYREGDGGEEIGPSLTTVCLGQKRSFLRYLSLSFIAQGRMSLQNVTSSLFSVLSDQDTPRFCFMQTWPISSRANRE